MLKKAASWKKNFVKGFSKTKDFIYESLIKNIIKAFYKTKALWKKILEKKHKAFLIRAVFFTESILKNKRLCVIFRTFLKTFLKPFNLKSFFFKGKHSLK